MRNIFLGYNADIKSSIKGTCVYCLRLSVVIHTLTEVHKCTKFHKQVIGTNIIYKFIMPEVVCCCLQTCNFCFDELLSWYISLPTLIVRGPGIHKHY